MGYLNYLLITLPSEQWTVACSCRAGQKRERPDRRSGLLVLTNQLFMLGTRPCLLASLGLIYGIKMKVSVRTGPCAPRSLELMSNC